MKKLFLPLPWVLLTFGLVANDVIADDRVILGSLERVTEKSDAPYWGDNVTRESTFNGFSAKLYWFRNEGFYFGLGLGYTTGDVDVCLGSNCAPADTKYSMFTREIGWYLGQWIPFVGGTWTSTQAEETMHRFWNTEIGLGFYPHSVIEQSADPFSLNIGVWREFDTFKVRGALNIWDESETPGISGGVLYQMDNEFAVGAEIDILLDGEANRFRFSLQFGRSF